MPSDRINLLMVVHCHQPVGNFDGVFEEAYNKSYLPFIEVLQRHPKIKVALHYSGCLIDWLKEKRPEFLDTVFKMAKAGRVEMVSGGYYEPILPLIPDRDKLGQIKELSDFIKKAAGCEPRGAWLAERVWEPYLARIFSQAGLRYTVVDDSHFELAGKRSGEILGYYVTEEEGHILAIFPSSKRLRYNMPFKLPHETIDYLRSVATPDGSRAVTFGDDGEKFGMWPQTYKWVYEERWLENFFSVLEDNSDWITVMTPAEYMERHKPLGRLYIPCASYPEMLEWSGGYFRNFLVKYPEANWMQKRMWYASDKLEETGDRGAKNKEAKRSLYRSQCNCAYWHGVFGGLYMHHLRTAVYQNIIDAENKMPGRKETKGAAEVKVLDIDKDGADEVILENGPLAVYVDPDEGGSIVELDYRPRSLNVVNTLARRPEAYHKKIIRTGNPAYSKAAVGNGVASIHDFNGAKERNLENFLNYDRHRKAFMMEHFLAEGCGPAEFAKADFRELGDFASSSYKYSVKKQAGTASVLLEKTGMLSLMDGKDITVNLGKSIQVRAGKKALDMSYRIKNMMDEEIGLWFGSEYNLSVRDPGLYKTGELLDIDQLEIKDEWFKMLIRYSLNREADLWFYPVETISESEAGLEKTYQEHCLLFNWRLKLKPGETWSVDIALTME